MSAPGRSGVSRPARAPSTKSWMWRRIAGRLATVGRRGLDVEGLGVGNALPEPFNPDAHALARNSSLDQDHLSLEPPDHPPPCGRLVDLERENVTGVHGAAGSGERDGWQVQARALAWDAVPVSAFPAACSGGM